MGENVCVLTYFKILRDPVKVPISHIPGRDVTCKTELGMGEREGERVNVTQKRSGKWSIKCNTRHRASILTPCSFGVLDKAEERWSEILIAPHGPNIRYLVENLKSQVSTPFSWSFLLYRKCGAHLTWCSDLDLQTAASSFQCCHFKHTVEPDFTWKR